MIQNQFTHYKFIFAVIAAATLSTACGSRSSDPAKAYSYTKEFVPEHNKQSPTQGFVLPNVIQVSGAGDLNFVQGKPSQYTINVAINDERISPKDYSVRLVKAPAGVSFGSAASPSGSYVLSWTPPENTLTPSEDFRSFGACLVIEFRKDLDVGLRNLMAGHKTEFCPSPSNDGLPNSGLTLIVRKSKEHPVIVDGDQPLLPQEVRQYEKIPFTIKAKVPGASLQFPPKAFIVDSSKGTKTYYSEIAGNKYVSKRAEPQFKEGLWIFAFELDTNNIVLPTAKKAAQGKTDGETEGVNLGFSVLVFSPQDLPAPEKRITVKVRYIPRRAPRIIIHQKTFDFEAKGPMKIAFTTEARLENRAITENQEAFQSSFATWTSKPTLSCKVDKGQEDYQTCTIEGKAECKTGTTKISLKVANTVNGESKASEETIIIAVKDSVQCEAKNEKKK